MGKCQTNSRIPYHLPWTGEKAVESVMHKTGTLRDVACDSGIVDTGEGAYVLSMFYNGHAATQAEKDAMHHHDALLAGISRDVYHAYANEDT